MSEPTGGPLAADELRRMHAYWRAANYLSVGQIYLLDNPLLREPLRLEHVKPRLLGHWGTTPGLNFLYVHMNRAIKARDLEAMYITGPGHGGPGLVANTYLEGTYSDVHHHIGRDEEGLRQLSRQSRSRAASRARAPETPGPGLDGAEGGRRPAAEGSFRSHQVPLAPAGSRSPSTSSSSRRGCAATAPRSCSTSTARSWTSSRASRLRVSGGWSTSGGATAPTRARPPTTLPTSATGRGPPATTGPTSTDELRGSRA